MPLHLLPKKSWNPYNPAAIARVRDDEAAAAVQEEAAEQRQLKRDAERRIAILRGVTPPPLLEKDEIADESTRERKHGRITDEPGAGGEWRRKRKRAGEDDTDRDIRLARQETNVESGSGTEASTDVRLVGDKEAPLHDQRGHIQLFAPSKEMERNEREGKMKPEKNSKKRERNVEEEKFGMRFDDAAGFKRGAAQAPWYASGGTSKELQDKEDDGPARRYQARLSASDPMAMMRSAQTQLKRVEREREQFRRERDRDFEDERMKKRPEKKRSRRDDLHGLEHYNLETSGRLRHRDSRNESKRQRHRSRSRGRSREDGRHASRHTHHEDQRIGQHHDSKADHRSSEHGSRNARVWAQEVSA